MYLKIGLSIAHAAQAEACVRICMPVAPRLGETRSRSRGAGPRGPGGDEVTAGISFNSLSAQTPGLEPPQVANQTSRTFEGE